MWPKTEIACNRAGARSSPFWPTFARSPLSPSYSLGSRFESGRAHQILLAASRLGRRPRARHEKQGTLLCRTWAISRPLLVDSALFRPRSLQDRGNLPFPPCLPSPKRPANRSVRPTLPAARRRVIVPGGDVPVLIALREVLVVDQDQAAHLEKRQLLDHVGPQPPDADHGKAGAWNSTSEVPRSCVRVMTPDRESSGRAWRQLDDALRRRSDGRTASRLPQHEGLKSTCSSLARSATLDHNCRPGVYLVV